MVTNVRAQTVGDADTQYTSPMLRIILLRYAGPVSNNKRRLPGYDGERRDNCVWTCPKYGAIAQRAE